MSVLEGRAWLARVMTPEGKVVGAAFVVDVDHIVTCAHVVQDAGAAQPGDVVSVDFPALGAKCQAEVLAEGWRPADGTMGDVALLALNAAPDGVQPAPLRALESLLGSPFVAYGFPEGYHDEVTTRGNIGYATGREWVQLEVTSALPVAPGFSGGAVWDTERGVVVAVMVTRDLGTGGHVAFAIPIGVLTGDSRIIQDALPTALELQPAAAVAHWDASARGVKVGEQGWSFTGRRRVLDELVAWLHVQTGAGMRVVTGSPGSGKSAVLARLVTSSDRRYRQRMPEAIRRDAPVAPVGCVDVPFHAADRTVTDFIAQVAAVCPLAAADVPSLLAAVGSMHRHLVVVVDALDEATEAVTLGRLLSELVARGARVLVGCRPHLVDRLRDQQPLNLDHPPWIDDADIELYVHRRLARQPLAGDRGQLAVEIAGAAAGNFLVARLLADSIVFTGGSKRPLASEVADAFLDLLERLPEREKVRELLLPLAYALGEGLPEDLWRIGATALGRPYHPGDIRNLLQGPPGSFLIGRGRYRLFHQELGDALANASDPEGDQRKLWRAWTRALERNDGEMARWREAPAYLLEHAADHAASAGTLAELARDPEFVLHGDLERLRVRLGSQGAAPEMAAILGLTAARALRLDPAQRAVCLALAAQHLGLPPVAQRILGAGATSWRPAWAHTLGPPHQVLMTASTGAVLLLALGRGGDRDLIVSSDEDGTVRVWDAVSLQLMGEIRGDYTDSVAVGRLGLSDVILIRRYDEVQVWDAASLDQPLKLTSTSARSGSASPQAVGRAGDQDIKAEGRPDGTVRLWRAVILGGVGGSPGHTGRVTSVAVGRVGGREIAVSASEDGTVRLWDATSGRPLGIVVSGHPGPVSSVTVGRIGHSDLIATIGGGVVRVWDAASLQSVGEPIPLPPEPEASRRASTSAPAAGGRACDSDIKVEGRHDGTIQVWRPPLGDSFRAATGHAGPVASIVIGRIRRRDVVVSGGETGTVQLWDARDGRPIGGPFPGHNGPVTAVAVGRIGRCDVIVSAGGENDGTVRVWDATTTPRPIGQPLVGHSGPVSALAVGRIGRRDVIVSAGSTDGTVRVWDATGGLPATESVTVDTGPVTAIAMARMDDADVILVAREHERATALVVEAQRASGGTRPVTLGTRDVIARVGQDGAVHLQDADTAGSIDELRGRKGWVDRTGWRVTAAGRAGARRVRAEGMEDGRVRIWRALTLGKLKGTTGHTGPVLSVAVGHMGGNRVVISGGQDGGVRVWDAASGRPIGKPLSDHTGPVISVAVGRLGGREVIVSASGTVRVWDAVSFQPVGKLTGYFSESVAIGRLDNHDVVVSASRRVVQVWDPTSLDLPLTLLRTGDSSQIAEAPTGGPELRVEGSRDGTVRMWHRLAVGGSEGPSRHTGSVAAVAVGRLGGRDVAVSGGEDGTVRVWDAISGRPVGEPLKGHTGPVASVAIGRIGGRDVVISAGRVDRAVRAWDGTSLEVLGDPLSLPVESGSVVRTSRGVVAAGRAGQRQVRAEGTDDGTVRVVDATSGEPVGEPLTGHTGPVSAVTIGHAGDRDVIVSASEDGTVRVWDAEVNTVGDPLIGHTGPVTALMTGSVVDRDVIVSASEDGTTRLWDPATGSQVGELSDSGTEFRRTIMTGLQSGRDIIVSGSLGETGGQLGAPARWPLVRPIPDRTGRDVKHVAVGRPGERRFIVSHGPDAKVRVWDEGKLVSGPLSGHLGPMVSAAVGHGASGDTVVIGGEGGTVRAWTPRSRAAMSLGGHTGPVRSVAVGRLCGRDIIVSGGSDNTLRLWDAEQMTELVVVHTLAPVSALLLAHDCVFFAVGRAVCLLTSATTAARRRCGPG